MKGNFKKSEIFALSILIIELIVLVFLLSGRSVKTAFTSVIGPMKASNYCDYSESMIVIDMLDALTERSAAPANDLSKITEEQRQLAYSSITMAVQQLDSMSVPDCLKLTVGYLRASYVDILDLLDGSKDKDVLGLLLTISTEQQLFSDEFARVKACVAEGCQPE